MTDRPIPEEHAELLRSALKLEHRDAPLPDVVVETYWDFERTARRMGQRIDGNGLVCICMLANRATLPDPVCFLDTKPQYGCKVLAKFRGEWRWGTFKALRGKRVIVQLDDDTAEDREFGSTSVRHPTKDEYAKVEL